MKTKIMLSAMLGCILSVVTVASSFAAATLYNLDTTYTKVTMNDRIATHQRVATLVTANRKMSGSIQVEHIYRAGGRFVTIVVKGYQPEASPLQEIVAIFKGEGADDDAKMRQVVDLLLKQEVVKRKPQAEYREQISQASY